MQIITPRSALLSNYEVLELLKEQEADYLSRTKTALRVKKEETDNSHGDSTVSGFSKPQLPPGGKDPAALPEISENMRTLQVQAIEYLSASYQPTMQQSPSGIKHLTQSLQPYDLTKAEKLQIINLAPKRTVELYVVVEEVEDRLGDKMDEVLQLISSSLDSSTTATTTATETATGTSASSPAIPAMHLAPVPMPFIEDSEVIAGEETYDDRGEGVGIEGDLEMEEE